MQPLNMGEAGKIQQEDQTRAMVDTIYKMITEIGFEVSLREIFIIKKN